MDLKTFIHNNALDMGFMAVGVAPALPLKEHEYLKQWLALGYHGSMEWLSKNPDKRCDPCSLFPDAKSVICLAFHYGENGIGEEHSVYTHKTSTARFSRGLEYHQFMKQKLQFLLNKIVHFNPKAGAKLCVDTSPILEKAFAVRAGIGWPGKNSVVIHPKKGSYFVLGEIITDLEIEPDSPLPNNCGDCNICINACPTQAIVKPGIIDIRRCLSYLTIEHKGFVPEEYLPHLKEGQYGCDICQEVCPYNKILNTKSK